MKTNKQVLPATVKWLLGIVASVITAVLIWWLTSPGGPLNQDEGAKARVEWVKNWEQINKPVPFLGTAGVQVTNRAKYLVRLEGLNFTEDPAMQALRNRLISLSREAPPYSDPSYDMVLTTVIQSDFDDLRHQVHDKALENGVDVKDHPP